MTTYPITTRRLILAGGFALAIAIAHAAAIVAHPTHSTESKPLASAAFASVTQRLGSIPPWRRTLNFGSSLTFIPSNNRSRAE